MKASFLCTSITFGKNLVFDPFKDFETMGYLRNLYKEKNDQIIKNIEHQMFVRNMSKAIRFLSSVNFVTYSEFLAVHRYLFSEFYPWAGQDRAVTSPNVGISKAGIQFCNPVDIRRAVNEGLRIGQIRDVMREKPGEVMGLFAYGHPFLDGNGRTMLLVHMELSYRSGFSIAWENTRKKDYLDALSEEIHRPGRGVLDKYLLGFVTDCNSRSDWESRIVGMKGLDGSRQSDLEEENLSDPVAREKYQQFERLREYTYGHADVSRDKCNVSKFQNRP